MLGHLAEQDGLAHPPGAVRDVVVTRGAPGPEAKSSNTVSEVATGQHRRASAPQENGFLHVLIGTRPVTRIGAGS